MHTNRRWFVVSTPIHPSGVGPHPGAPLNVRRKKFPDPTDPLSDVNPVRELDSVNDVAVMALRVGDELVTTQVEHVIFTAPVLAETPIGDDAVRDVTPPPPVPHAEPVPATTPDESASRHCAEPVIEDTVRFVTVVTPPNPTSNTLVPLKFLA